MGCKCANSNNDEYEVINKERVKDNNNISNKNENNLNQLINDNKENMNNQNNNSNEFNNYSNEYEGNQNQNQSQNENNESNHFSKYLNYPEKIVEIINSIRQDPVSYSYTIEDSIKNIIENNNKDQNRIIYKKKVKVALSRGEEAFREAAEELRKMNPLPPLEFLPALCIPLPETEEEIKDSTFLKNQVLELRNEGIRIDVFFKDLVKIPEVSALLMIVDDNGKNAGKKRKTLLSKDFKYIGVTSKFFGKTFISYLGFSK
jgi:hypothetical protein